MRPNTLCDYKYKPVGDTSLLSCVYLLGITKHGGYRTHVFAVDGMPAADYLMNRCLYHPCCVTFQMRVSLYKNVDIINNLSLYL